MKKSLLLIILITVCSVIFAQKGYQDTIFLKNGTSVNGKVIESDNDNSLEIQTVDNKLLIFDMNKIKRIATEPFIEKKDTQQNSKIYRTWIKLDNYTKSGNILYGQPKRTGVLYQIKDSSIIVANYLNKRDFLSGKHQTTEIDYKNIGTVETRRKNSVIRGALSGLIIGSLAGVIIGYSSGSDHPTPGSFDFFVLSASDKATIGGIFSGLTGIAIGTLVGTIRIRIPINRSIDNFNKNKERLKKYSYIN
ncbi:MAG: hypothetical protein ABSG89_07335 [Bacteroidales bacterium]|jgi:hypothetical protein